MRDVIRIDGQVQEDEKPIEITHVLDVNIGWCHSGSVPLSAKRIVYLGSCAYDKDMFCVYSDCGCIEI